MKKMKKIKIVIKITIKIINENNDEIESKNKKEEEKKLEDITIPKEKIIKIPQSINII